MKWLGLALLPMLLVGCSSAPKGSGPEAECRQQAYEDPAVKRELLPNRALDNGEHDFKLALALRDATNACLRQRGIQIPGGVEPVQMK